MKSSHNLCVICLIISFGALSCSQGEDVVLKKAARELSVTDDLAYDNDLRDVVRLLWTQDPLNKKHTLDTEVSELHDKYPEYTASLRSTREDTVCIDDLLMVADAMTLICPADYKSSKEYTAALDSAIVHKGGNLPKVYKTALHEAAVAASEVTFLKYEDNLEGLKVLWYQTYKPEGSLRANEPYGEREANAFSYVASKIGDWWRSHDCVRGIISGGIGGAIGGLIGGGAGALYGAIGGAIGGGLQAC